MTNTNIATITPHEILDMFPFLYAAAIKRGDIGLQPAKMLWGMPGIGKSDVIKQMAEKTAELTGKKCNVTVASLLLMSPVDLRGIPTKDEVEVDGAKELVARWLKPQIFQMDPSDDVLNFLFLDEISAAPPAVQAAAYQIVLDRRVGEHQFPANCVVIAAGNRVTDRAVAYKMPKPLANRFTHYEMTIDADDWCQWAYAHGIHQYIIGYIRFNPDHLVSFDPSNDDVAFPTPRSWELVNQYLIDGAEYAKARGLNVIDAMYANIAGTIGASHAIDFKAYVDVYANLPTWADIASGKAKKCTIDAKELGTLYALASMLVVNSLNEFTKLAGKADELTKFLDTVGVYINTMPRKDISTLIMRDLLRSASNEARNAIVRNKQFAAVLRDVVDLIV